MMNFFSPQFFTKWFVCNALLHRPRQCKYLGYVWISFNPDNRILRYQRKYIINQHKIMGAWRRIMPLHRYYSSSLSPYGACSTSHCDHHCAPVQQFCFWEVHLGSANGIWAWNPWHIRNLHHDDELRCGSASCEVYRIEWDFACKFVWVWTYIHSKRRVCWCTERWGQPAGEHLLLAIIFKILENERLASGKSWRWLAWSKLLYEFPWR